MCHSQPSLSGFDRFRFPSDEPLNTFSRGLTEQRGPYPDEEDQVRSPLMAHFRESITSPHARREHSVAQSRPEEHFRSATSYRSHAPRSGRRASSAYDSRPLGSYVRDMSHHVARMHMEDDFEALEKQQVSPGPSEDNAEHTYSDTAPLTQGTCFTETKPDGTFRQLIFVVIVCSVQYLSLAGLAQTFAPLNVLSDSLNINNPEATAWPTAAYSLALGSCILMAGRLGDLLGHRIVFISGWLWFGFASVGCGFSFYGGWHMLTACRAVQGIGPALLVPNALALISRKFAAGVKRNISISLFAGAGPCGFASGAVVSSLFSELLWWPWQFWAMGIVCITLSVLTIAAVPYESDDAYVYSWTEFWRLFDLLGACTGISALTLIGIALVQGPIVGYSKPYIITFLGLGVILICIFCYTETRVATKPLLPLTALGAKVGFTLVCICAGWGSQGIWCFFLFLRWENIQGYDSLAACAHFWPIAPVGLAAAVTVGLLLKRVKVAWVLTVAMLAFLLGSLLLAIPPGSYEYAATLCSIIIAPLGMNWSFPTAVILISSEVTREHQGIAASLVATVLNFSISTGLGLAGNIVHGITPTQTLLETYQAAWYFGAALAGFGLFISLCFTLRSRK